MNRSGEDFERHLRAFRTVFRAVLVFCLVGGCSGELEDVTGKVFGENSTGILAAFGDFNSDKLTDVFVIHGNNVVQVYLAYNDPPYLRPSTKCEINLDGIIITSVVPGDFDGDSAMDAVISFQKASEDFTSVFIAWGDLNRLQCEVTPDKLVTAKSKGQPTILDFNGDRIPDILIESVENGSRQILQMGRKRNFTVVPFEGADPIKNPHSNAFADMDGDVTADLVITTTVGLEIWSPVNGGNSSVVKRYAWPKGNVRIGQITLLDMDLDGKMDVIVPVCFKFETACTNSSILILRNDTWVTVFADFKSGDILWGVVPEKSNARSMAMTTFTLRVGDFNSDGYPDLITVLENTGDPANRQAFILQNVPSNDKVLGRTFEVLWHLPGLEGVKGVTMATFYDFYNDGILDVLLVAEKSEGTWETRSLVNNFGSDACFIKVIVLSGLCYTNCPLENIPFGTNQPGPSICYKTTWHDGSSQFSCATQLSQSAHFALQLPYVFFGLGPNPNFIDKLKVGIPHPQGEVVRKHEWTAIIPNSQMFVIPHLEGSGNRWYNKLFVPRSDLILVTFSALLGTMFIVALVVLVLHWKEKREDKQAKMQESYRFHFDAL